MRNRWQIEQSSIKIQYKFLTSQNQLLAYLLAKF